MIMNDPQKRPPTARELAAESSGEPLFIAGRPADACPYCGCAMFGYGTNKLQTRIERYVRCRNASCGKKFFTSQPPAEIVREIDGEE